MPTLQRLCPAAGLQELQRVVDVACASTVHGVLQLHQADMKACSWRLVPCKGSQTTSNSHAVSSYCRTGTDRVVLTELHRSESYQS